MNRNNQQSPGFPEDEEVDLFDYLRVLLENRWFIFWGTLCTVICTGIGTLYVEQNRPYEAVASFLPSEQSDYLNTGITEQEINQNLYPKILESRHVLLNMVQASYTDSANEQMQSQTLLQHYESDSPNQAMALLNENTDVERSREGLIEIRVRDQSPSMAAAIVNEYIKQLQQFNQETRNVNANANLQFIQKRLVELEQELHMAEDHLADFVNKNRQILATTPASGVALSSQPALQVEYDRLRRDVTSKAGLYETISKQYELAKIEAQKEELNIIVLSYAEPPNHPMPSKLKRNVLIALLVGGFVFVTASFIRHYFQHIDSERKEFLARVLTNDLHQLDRVKNAFLPKQK